MPLLEAKNISRAFGGLLAVDNVSFSIDSGEIVGLIGPNGAGQSRSASDKWPGESIADHGDCPEAVLECTRHSVVEGGDHLSVLGSIKKARHRPGSPLLYYQGQYNSGLE